MLSAPSHQCCIRKSAWQYAQNKEDHGVFKNNPQTPVDVQLAVTLYCMGCFGNDASLEDLARTAGCSEQAVQRGLLNFIQIAAFKQLNHCMIFLFAH